MSKLSYFVKSALGYFTSKSCPHCGNGEVQLADRKYVVTRLFLCKQCKLQFRHPLDSENFNSSFYQEDYSQDDGITTDLPSQAQLKSLIDSDFADSPKNVETFVGIFQSLGLNAGFKLIDYGCSWGYMSYQFKRRGFSTQSFEISRPRADFGSKNLGLSIVTSESDLKEGNDIFFSSHVIEHVPSIASMISASRKLLSANGFFIAEFPNGSSAFRNKNPLGFHLAWGLVHPNYLSEAFCQYLFMDNPYLIISSPYDIGSIGDWDQESQKIGSTDGDQLLVIAKVNSSVSRK